MEPHGVSPTRRARPDDFETVYIPVTTKKRKHCVVCHEQGLRQNQSALRIQERKQQYNVQSVFHEKLNFSVSEPLNMPLIFDLFWLI